MTGDKIIINGYDASGDIKGSLDALNIQYGFADNNTYGYTIANEITVENAAFDLLDSIFFTDICSGVRQTVNVQIYDSCCDIWLDFHIEHQDIKKCSDCTIKFSLSHIAPERKCYNYLNSTIWWKNGYCDNYTGPIMEYVVQLQGSFKILYYIMELIAVILTAIFIICNVIKYLLEAIDFVLNIGSVILSPFSSLIGAVGDFLNIGAQWEYSGTGDVDTIPCKTFLQGLSWDGNGQLTAQEIDDLCNNFDGPQCFSILKSTFPNANLAERSDMCEAIKKRIEQEQLGFPPDTGFFNLNCDWADPTQIYDLVKGNCRWVQTPKLIDIARYHAQACGLSINAPVLEAGCPLLFCLTAGAGTDKNDLINNNNRFIKDAASNKTVVQLLDEWSNDFNADWIIKDGVLYFDRVDKIDALKNELTTTLRLSNEDRLVGESCIEYIDDNAPSSMRPEFCQDSYDTEGNDASVKYGHGDLIEWNPEGADWKDGELTVELSSGAARFMHDQITYESSGAFGFDRQIDKLRATNRGSFFGTIVGGIRTLLTAGILPKGKTTQNALIIGGFAERTSCCKILYMDPISSNDDAKVVKRLIGMKGGFAHYCYNYPMYMTEDEPTGLYVNNHSIKNPNLTGREVAKLTGLKFKYTCDDLKAVHGTPCGWTIGTSVGPANVVDIKFNRKDQTATVDVGNIRC